MTGKTNFWRSCTSFCLKNIFKLLFVLNLVKLLIEFETIRAVNAQLVMLNMKCTNHCKTCFKRSRLSWIPCNAADKKPANDLWSLQQFCSELAWLIQDTGVSAAKAQLSHCPLANPIERPLRSNKHKTLLQNWFASHYIPSPDSVMGKYFTLSAMLIALSHFNDEIKKRSLNKPVHGPRCSMGIDFPSLHSFCRSSQMLR